VVLLSALVSPMAAQAAPFCLQTQAIGPQCIYYDAGLCQKDAARQGGFCGANPDEVHLSANIGKYCVVTSGQASLCIYLDRGTCTTEAVRQGGACTESTGTAGTGAPDPYAAIGGR
jgi:hypothetical protein